MKTTSPAFGVVELPKPELFDRRKYLIEGNDVTTNTPVSVS
jgi:hypothetical protein